MLRSCAPSAWLRCCGDENTASSGNESEFSQNLDYFCRIRALLCYRELRVSYDPPRAVHLLKDVQAAVRFSNLFAILRALDGPALHILRKNPRRTYDLLLAQVREVGQASELETRGPPEF